MVDKKDDKSKPSPLNLKEKEPKTFEFGKTVHRNLRLLEVSEKLLEEIEKDGVTIKGSEDSEAVLTTRDKTFMIKYVETTNLQLLVAPPRNPLCVSPAVPESESDAKNGANLDPHTRDKDSQPGSCSVDDARGQQGDPGRVTVTAITAAHIELVEIAPLFGGLKGLLGKPYTVEEAEAAASRAIKAKDLRRSNSNATAKLKSATRQIDPALGLEVGLSSGFKIWNRIVPGHASKTEYGGPVESERAAATSPGAAKRPRRSDAALLAAPRAFRTTEDLLRVTQASVTQLTAELDRLGCVAMRYSSSTLSGDGESGSLDLTEDEDPLVWRLVDPKLTSEVLDNLLLTAQQVGWSLKNLSEHRVLEALALDSATPSKLSDATAALIPLAAPRNSDDTGARFPPELVRHCLGRFGKRLLVETSAAGTEAEDASSSGGAGSWSWTLDSPMLHRHYARRVMEKVPPAVDPSSPDQIQDPEAPSWAATRTLPLASFLTAWLEALEAFVAFAYPPDAAFGWDLTTGEAEPPVADSSAAYVEPPGLDILCSELIVEGLPSPPAVDVSSLAHLSAAVGFPTGAVSSAAGQGQPVSGTQWAAAVSAAAGHPAAAEVSVRLLCLGELPPEPSERFRILFKVRPRWLAADLQPFITDLKVPGQSAEALLLRYARASQPAKDAPLVFSAR